MSLKPWNIDSSLDIEWLGDKVTDEIQHWYVQSNSLIEKQTVLYMPSEGH